MNAYDDSGATDPFYFFCTYCKASCRPEVEMKIVKLVTRHEPGVEFEPRQEEFNQ